MRRVIILVAVLLALAAFGRSGIEPGHCPLCGATGKPLVQRDELGHCECEGWWGDHAPARLAFADCSERSRVDSCAKGSMNTAGIAPDIIYVDLHLYRCPHDGLLFTRPE